MDFNNKIQLRTWSMLGKRGTFGSALTELAPKYDDLMAVSADFARSSGLDRFSRMYPEKFLDVGIAEQNLIGISSGLASEGYNVFATSFAAFIATRSYEQVKIHCGYMKHNIKIVGLAAGFGVQQQGNTHYGLDDISLMRSIPGLTIISPADSAEVVKSVEALLNYVGPAYLRLCGEAGDPMVYKCDYEFKIGKAVVLLGGSDVTIVATGTMVAQSMKAAKLLSGRSVSCTVINLHTIYPLDTETINKYCHDCQLLVTIEEGFISGGIGAAVLEEVAQSGKRIPQMLMLGLTDFPHAGSYNYLLEQTGLNAENIAANILLKLGR